MESLRDVVKSVILDPKNASALAAVKAARNGAVYGAKVRFPHALVMVFLFRSGTLRDKLGLIFKATRQHARNLATFAFLYKAVLLALRSVPSANTSSSSTIKPRQGKHDTFLSGLVAGYVVFGRGFQSSVNQQIVIYIFARVVLALAKLSVQESEDRGFGMGKVMSARQLQGWKRVAARNAWPVFASVSWGAVMWLFRWYPETLQPSLKSSMTYIYEDCDHWDGLRNFFIHNK